jgi:hypothetical protein
VSIVHIDVNIDTAVRDELAFRARRAGILLVPYIADLLTCHALEAQNPLSRMVPRYVEATYVEATLIDGPSQQETGRPAFNPSDKTAIVTLMDGNLTEEQHTRTPEEIAADRDEMERRAREEPGRDAEEAIVTEYAHRIIEAAMPAIEAMVMKLARQHTAKAFAAHIDALKTYLGSTHDA